METLKAEMGLDLTWQTEKMLCSALRIKQERIATRGEGGAGGWYGLDRLGGV